VEVSVSNPLASLSGNGLVAQHALHPLDNHYLSEKLRRHMEGSAKLGKAMWVLTVILVILTVVLVLFEGAVIKRSYESVTTGAWLLWQSTTSPSGEERWLINVAFSHREGGKSACESARIKREEELRKQVEVDFKRMGKAYFSVLTCLPDTVDPRGPKGAKWGCCW